jgi:hypothetical protein
MYVTFSTHVCNPVYTQSFAAQFGRRRRNPLIETNDLQCCLSHSTRILQMSFKKLEVIWIGKCTKLYGIGLCCGLLGTVWHRAYGLTLTDPAVPTRGTPRPRNIFKRRNCYVNSKGDWLSVLECEKEEETEKGISYIPLLIPNVWKKLINIQISFIHVIFWCNLQPIKYNQIYKNWHLIFHTTCFGPLVSMT